MKWIFGTICLTACLAAVSATFCSSEDDCRDGFCCVALTARQMLKRGLCRRLARERKACSEPESKDEYHGGKYLINCPCAEGLVCGSDKPGKTDTKRISDLRCRKPSATTAGPDITTASNIVTDEEIVTNPPDVVTDDNIVDETPEEEVIETESPEEEVVEEETEAPEEEVVEEETEAPEEEVLEEETEAPEEEIVEEAGQQGPGGERPREDDPDCEDWTYGC